MSNQDLVSYLMRALDIFEQRQVLEHRDRASTLDRLASLYREQGKYEQAEPFYQQAVAIREQQLGPKHPHTQKAGKDYASLLRVMGREEEARKLEKDS